jgi:hypothetical protein
LVRVVSGEICLSIAIVVLFFWDLLLLVEEEDPLLLEEEDLLLLEEENLGKKKVFFFSKRRRSSSSSSKRRRSCSSRRKRRWLVWLEPETILNLSLMNQIIRRHPLGCLGLSKMQDEFFTTMKFLYGLKRICQD